MPAASAAAPAAKAAAVDAAETPAKPAGKKKLLVMIVAATLVLAGAGGGGALWWMKKRSAALAAEEEGGDGAEVAKSEHKDEHGAPTFVPLEMFTVNLADRETERYAQIGITLEIDDPKIADQLKVYMPAVRNNILMALAAKTSQDLLDREGKVKLAIEIRREAARGLGIDIPADEAKTTVKTATPAGTASAAKPGRKPEVHNPITRVHFSNFIIQ